MLTAESLDVQIKKLCFILLYFADKIRLIFFEHVFCAQTVVIKHVNITVRYCQIKQKNNRSKT